MAKEKKIYLGQVEGEAPLLYRSTDPRLVRRHILAGMFPPKIEVRIPGTEEAMNMALDGVAVVDVADDEGSPASGAPDPNAASGDLLGDKDDTASTEIAGGASTGEDESWRLDPGLDQPREELDINGDVIETDDRQTNDAI